MGEWQKQPRLFSGGVDVVDADGKTIYPNLDDEDAEQIISDHSEIERLRAALTFYADPKNYENTDNSCGDPECCGGPSPSYAVVNDEGERAREALAAAQPPATAPQEDCGGIHARLKEPGP